jgi:hypothetical protein
MISRVIILVLVVVTISCDNVNRGPERVAVARAGDRVLYLDQIPATLIAPSMSKTDSISVVQSYIRRWARKELVALKAEENLTSGYKAEVNRQLDEMRNNLLIYQYEQQMIIQKMDTTVTDSELQNYYISNLSTFNLSSNIVKALFIKLPDGTPGIERVMI